MQSKEGRQEAEDRLGSYTWISTSSRSVLGSVNPCKTEQASKLWPPSEKECFGGSTWGENSRVSQESISTVSGRMGRGDCRGNRQKSVVQTTLCFSCSIHISSDSMIVRQRQRGMYPQRHLSLRSPCSCPIHPPTKSRPPYHSKLQHAPDTSMPAQNRWVLGFSGSVFEAASPWPQTPFASALLPCGQHASCWDQAAHAALLEHPLPTPQAATRAQTAAPSSQQSAQRR